jgi:hypothetical protein
MITEYLFYTKLLACAQVNINMLHNQTQMAEAEYFSNWTYWFGEIQTQSEALFQKRDSEVRRSK